MSNNRNSILERIYYAFEVELCSPLCVSGADSKENDKKIIRTSSGEPFVPGSSIAGVFQAYVNSVDSDKGSMDLFNPQKEINGRNTDCMSAIRISDMFFQKEDNLSKVFLKRSMPLIYGVKDSRKSEVYIEAVNTGAKGVIYMECICNETAEKERFEKLITYFIQGIQSEEIRIGYHATRGFGHLKINRIYRKAFTALQVNEWISFMEYRGSNERLSLYSCESYDEWKKRNDVAVEHQYIKISVPLRITSAISLREIGNASEEYAYVCVKDDGVAIIPGTTWAGAIRNHMHKLLHLLECDGKTAELIVSRWFGHLSRKDIKDKGTLRSRIVFSESRIEATKDIVLSRGGQDRYTGGAQNGVLFTEQICYGGQTKLEIMVDKRYNDYKAILGMLFHVIKDLQKGYLAVGGQSALGRGIFEFDENTGSFFSEEVQEDECLQILYQYIEKEINVHYED